MHGIFRVLNFPQSQFLTLFDFPLTLTAVEIHEDFGALAVASRLTDSCRGVGVPPHHLRFSFHFGKLRQDVTSQSSTHEPETATESLEKK